MAELDISGSYLVTIGRGAGPETWLFLSVQHADGTPALLNFPDPATGAAGPVDVFVGLSAMFGAFDLPVRIVEVQPMPLGFYGLRLEGTDEFDRDIAKVSPTTLGIIVSSGGDRGQGIACACSVGTVTSWLPDRTQDPPRG